MMTNDPMDIINETTEITVNDLATAALQGGKITLNDALQIIKCTSNKEAIKLIKQKLQGFKTNHQTDY